ncbi:MAG: hypothetical protein JWQ27_1384 [Ferruginibacter sp.]|nr:hypothetical protein [Ferruginibacter sp.]
MARALWPNNYIMKKLTALTLLATSLCLFSQKSMAQYYFFDDTYYDNPILFEVGISANAMNALTDIGGKKGIGAKFFKDVNFGKTHFSGGFFFSAAYKNAVALRLEATVGRISADDNVLVGVTDIAKERFNRNLSFRSDITEVALMAEIHPLFIFINWPSKDVPPPRYSPYLIAGVGYFSYNPQTKLGNNWVNLQPLSTEGQGFKEYPDRPVYKLQQMNIPIGGGLKYDLSPFFNLRGEFVYRKLNTDYLDDLSTRYVDPSLYANYFTGTKLTNATILSDRQIIHKTNPGGKRGSPAQKDAYFSFNLKLSLVIGRERIRNY